MRRTRRRSILDRLPAAEEENAIWKPIPGYEGFYEVNDRGGIRGVDRELDLDHRYGGAITHRRRGLELTTQLMKNGRLYVCLSREGRAATLAVANIVLETFGGPRPPDSYAAAQDDDPNHCAVENLVWRKGKRRAGARKLPSRELT